MPVLPPTAASTIPANVVATWTTRIPRSQAAATHPARSVVDPPPRPTIASLRVKPIWPRTSQQKPATARVLASSASGTSMTWASKPSAARSSRTASAVVRSVGGWITATRAAPASNGDNSPSSPVPMTTSYGTVPSTGMRVVTPSPRAARRSRPTPANSSGGRCSRCGWRPRGTAARGRWPVSPARHADSSASSGRPRAVADAARQRADRRPQQDDRHAASGPGGAGAGVENGAPAE